MTRGKRPAPTPEGGQPRGADIEWTARALADLEGIDEFIAARSPLAAERWVARLVACAQAAAASPLAGRVVPERAQDGVREVLCKSYRIVYRVKPRGILVLTVFEGHRLFPLDAAPVDGG